MSRESDLGWRATLIFGILAVIAGVIVGVVACWSHGPIASRLGGTAGLIAGPGLLALFAYAMRNA